MANLNALVDLFLHPDIPYFDKEHLIVGGTYAIFSIVLLSIIFAYTNRVAASAAMLDKLNKNLHEQSIRDGLTGLYNHRHFHDMLRHEFLVARRHNHDLTCMMLDLDHFKDINDNCGHQFGDYVLRETATKILEETRESDIVARYGGEEFAILLPSTDLTGALTIAERIRINLEKHVHKQENYSAQVSVSVGLATFIAHKPLQPKELLAFADKALYSAKGTGRNKVATYSA